MNINTVQKLTSTIFFYSDILRENLVLFPERCDGIDIQPPHKVKALGDLHKTLIMEKVAYDAFTQRKNLCHKFYCMRVTKENVSISFKQQELCLCRRYIRHLEHQVSCSLLNYDVKPIKKKTFFRYRIGIQVFKT